MNTVLAELGRRYLERWVAVLVLPGLLYVVCAVVARRLGHARWADVDRLAAVPEIVASADARGTGVWVLTLLALPVLSAAVGLAAQGVAAALGRLWFEAWPRLAGRLARVLTAVRAGRWSRVDARYSAELENAGTNPSADARARIDALAARRNAVCLVPPVRPTWTGDRLNAVDSRVWAWYRLDIAFAWPRMWLVLTEPEQNTLRAARGELDAAVALAAWGVLYAPLALWWWPALLIAAIAFAAGLRRTRAAVDTLAHLTEAAFDLRAVTLARELGFPVEEGTRLSPETGAQITSHLRKHS